MVIIVIFFGTVTWNQISRWLNRHRGLTSTLSLIGIVAVILMGTIVGLVGVNNAVWSVLYGALTIAMAILGIAGARNIYRKLIRWHWLAACAVAVICLTALGGLIVSGVAYIVFTA